MLDKHPGVIFNIIETANTTWTLMKLEDMEDILEVILVMTEISQISQPGASAGLAKRCRPRKKSCAAGAETASHFWR